MKFSTTLKRGTIVRLSALILANLLCYFSFPVVIRQLNVWSSDVDGAAHAYDDIQIVETSSQPAGAIWTTVVDNCLGTNFRGSELPPTAMVIQEGQTINVAGPIASPEVRAVLSNLYKYDGLEPPHNVPLGGASPGYSIQFVFSQLGHTWKGTLTSRSRPAIAGSYEVTIIHSLKVIDRRELACLVF